LDSLIEVLKVDVEVEEVGFVGFLLCFGGLGPINYTRLGAYSSRGKFLKELMV